MNETNSQSLLYCTNASKRFSFTLNTITSNTINSTAFIPFAPLGTPLTHCTARRHTNHYTLTTSSPTHELSFTHHLFHPTLPTRHSHHLSITLRGVTIDCWTRHLPSNGFHLTNSLRLFGFIESIDHMFGLNIEWEATSSEALKR
ncbi:unnamed protein product, partial [Medioppia subpectinata]